VNFLGNCLTNVNNDTFLDLASLVVESRFGETKYSVGITLN